MTYLLSLDPMIGVLFHQLLNPPDGTQLFCNRLDLCEQPIEKLLEKNLLVAGVALDDGWKPSYYTRYAHHLKITEHPDLELFKPEDEYHLAFSTFPFLFDLEAAAKDDLLAAIKPVLLRDRLQFFRCSQGKEQREVPYHILGLEQMLRSILCGGYFAAVLPKRWIGREMKYLGWWNDHAARVARIKLPTSAVSLLSKPDDHGKYQNAQPAPGEWEFLIWTRRLIPEDDIGDTTSRKHSKKLGYAQQSHAEFVFDLSSGNSRTLSQASITECQEAFQQHNWYEFSVEHWQALLEDHHADYDIGTWNNEPRELRNPKNIYFFNPRPEFATGLRVLASVDEIKKLPRAVHIKAGRRIKLKCYNVHSSAAVLDLKHGNDVVEIEASDGKKTVFKYDIQLRYKPYSEIKEKLIFDLENIGLVPCMTEIEYYNLLKRERWLAVQLTPVERMIPVGKEAKAHHEGLQTGEAKYWEKAYSEIGMEASFPEIMEMWRRRAEHMNMQRYLFDFQIEDVIYEAAKQCLLNGNVPGLGKTRETLMTQLLRGARHTLIIVPTKLMGVWQDEIDNTIVPYCRQQRRDWQGNILDPSYQIIEWAKDCLPVNLKTFNLISYDKLKTTPRDGLFYKCPRCGTIVYSAKAIGKAHAQDIGQVCPGDPSLPADSPSRCNNLIARWRKLCAGNPDLGVPAKRKLLVFVDDWGEPLKRLVEDKDAEGNVIGNHEEYRIARPSHPGWKGRPVLGSKYAAKFPVESERPVKRIDDPRPPKPSLPSMEPLTHIYKKVKKVLVGYESDKRTGEQTPIYRNIERKSHVKWTFAELLRWRFDHLVADEALNFVNEDAQRTRAMYHLTGRQRQSLTGTPMKNKPENILGIMNWTFGSSVFPSYRSYDPDGLKRFLDKYRTVVYIEAGEIPGAEGYVAGKEKPIPKVNNPELFQAEMAPHMIRHVRNEPRIQKDIPPIPLMHHDIKVEMDTEHKAYYKLFLAEFAEWWGKMKEEEEGKSGLKGGILPKIMYLANCSITPFSMMENILEGSDIESKQWAKKIGTYKDFCEKRFGVKPRPTAKMRKAFDIIKAAVKDGDKTLVFSMRHNCLHVGEAWCKKKGLESMVIHGGISNKIMPGQSRSKRHQMVENFRNLSYHALWAGAGTLDVGFNIPEANHGIILDCGWEDTTPTQGIGRMIRPAQTKSVHRYNMMHLGAIDDYMFALSYLKGRSGMEAIDYMEFDDFSTAIIPDIHQYANAIVDGTEEEFKRRMWLAVDHLRKQDKEEGTDQESE